MIGMVIQLATAPMGLHQSNGISIKIIPPGVVHNGLTDLFIFLTAQLY